MTKFQVELSRRSWHYEQLLIEIDAKNASEARKIAKERLKNDESIANADWDPSSGDSGYDDFDIEVHDR